MKIFPGNTGTKPTCVLGSSEQAAVGDQLQQVGLKTVRASQLVMIKKLNLSFSTVSLNRWWDGPSNETVGALKFLLRITVLESG